MSGTLPWLSIQRSEYSQLSVLQHWHNVTNWYLTWTSHLGFLSVLSESIIALTMCSLQEEIAFTILHPATNILSWLSMSIVHSCQHLSHGVGISFPFELEIHYIRIYWDMESLFWLSASICSLLWSNRWTHWPFESYSWVNENWAFLAENYVILEYFLTRNM